MILIFGDSEIFGYSKMSFITRPFMKSQKQVVLFRLFIQCFFIATCYFETSSRVYL